MLGSHNFLTSGTSGDDREMGIKTNDQNIIEKLIGEYENASDLTKAVSKPKRKRKPKPKPKQINNKQAA